MSIWRSIQLVSLRFDLFRFVLFRSVSICFVSFRSVSFVSFRFDLFRFVPFRVCFVSHFTGIPNECKCHSPYQKNDLNNQIIDFC